MTEFAKRIGPRSIGTLLENGPIVVKTYQCGSGHHIRRVWGKEDFREAEICYLRMESGDGWTKGVWPA